MMLSSRVRACRPSADDDAALQYPIALAVLCVLREYLFPDDFQIPTLEAESLCSFKSWWRSVLSISRCTSRSLQMRLTSSRRFRTAEMRASARSGSLMRSS